MKLKPIKLTPLQMIIAALILGLLIAGVIFVAKIRFVKPNEPNQPISPTNTVLPALPDQKFSPRDPNLNNEQNLVKDYISAHLAKLSPTKAVLGGSWHLTDIKFPLSNEADISYEDGHIALQARVSYDINPKELKITTFKITKEN